jgi:hypothetical protein
VVTTRQKFKNLQREPKATLFIMDPANPFTTLEIRATTTLTADPEKSMLPKFAEHYATPEEMLDLPDTERVTVEFDPTRIVASG